MPHYSLLNISISLVTNNKINYDDVAIGEGLLTLVGIGLWVLSIDVWRGQSRARKLAGAFLLLVAAGYSVAWVEINFWGFNYLKDYF